MIFFFPSPVDPWRNFQAFAVFSSFSFCDVARHWINHHGSCPDDWYAGDTLCRRCLWAARNCIWLFWVRPQKKGSSLHPQDCQNLPKFRLFDGFLHVSQQKTKTCPLHPYGSLLQEISNFSDGRTLLDENPKPRYLREHTAIAMGLVAALLIGIVGLSRHQNFSTKFSKR